MKPSEKWLKMAEIYKIFAEDWADVCTFDKKAAEAMFKAESLGRKYFFPYNQPNKNGKFNGFAVGKHWMDATIAMWIEDIKSGNLTKIEIYEDSKFPRWWSEKLLANIQVDNP